MSSRTPRTRVRPCCKRGREGDRGKVGRKREGGRERRRGEYHKGKRNLNKKRLGSHYVVLDGLELAM